MIGSQLSSASEVLQQCRRFFKVMMSDCRRFFKVMMSNFRSKLHLPVVFCRQLKGERLDRAVLKGSGREWHIKVGKCSNGSLCFEQGWGDFVKHHDLNRGDFVVFEHNGDLIFDAIVFDSSTCEKEIPASINLSSKKVKNKQKRVLCNEGKRHHKKVHFKGKSPLEDAKAYSTSSPHFITTVTASNGPDGMSYLHVPAEFARSKNLDRASIVILRDSTRKLWPVKLYTRECDSKCRENMRKRTTMTKGWHDFYVANNLKKGDVCLFELDLTGKKSFTLVMDVHIFSLVL